MLRTRTRRSSQTRDDHHPTRPRSKPVWTSIHRFVQIDSHASAPLPASSNNDSNQSLSISRCTSQTSPRSPSLSTIIAHHVPAIYKKPPLCKSINNPRRLLMPPCKQRPPIPSARVPLYSSKPPSEIYHCVCSVCVSARDFFSSDTKPGCCEADCDGEGGVEGSAAVSDVMEGGELRKMEGRGTL